MKVLSIATDYTPNAFGGVGIYATKLNTLLPKFGVQVDVITTRPGPDRMVVDPSILPSPKISAPGWDAVRVLNDNTALLHTLMKVWDRYDLVNFHDVYSAIAPLYLAATTPGPKTVLTKHTGPTPIGSTTSGFTGPLEEYMSMNLNELERWSIIRSDGVIAVAAHMADRIGDMYGRKELVEICPPAVDSALFTTNQRVEDHIVKDNFEVLVPGRLSQRKGGEVAMEALVHSSFGNWSLTFA